MKRSSWQLISILVAIVLLLSPLASYGTASASTLLSINIVPQNPIIAVTQTQQFTAIGTYADGSTADITTQVNWLSSNTTVASIGPTGQALGITPGQTNIIAILGPIISASTILTVTPPLLPTLAVTRYLPSPPTVSPGQTFDVSVRFNAQADQFNSIGMSDYAPPGWSVAADTTWCTPAATLQLITGNRVDYIWASTFSSGTPFNAVYKVTVPLGTPPGLYDFPTGSVTYYLGPNGPFTASITTAYQIQVVPLTTPPAVVTLPASAVTANCATLNAALLSLGAAPFVNVSFEYGLMAGMYTNSTPPMVMTATGPFSFTICGLAPCTTYHFRARAVGDGVAYGPDITFTTPCPTLPGITVTLPNGGEFWPIGTSQNITWTSTGLIGDVRIELSRDAGATWAFITGSTPNTGGYPWASVTGPATTQARIKVTKATDPGITDTSDSNFNIAGVAIAPVVATLPASAVTENCATLNASLLSLGTAPFVAISFEYGLMAGMYTNSTPPAVMTAAGPFSVTICGLAPCTTYHFRIKAVGDGVAYGPDITFTTLCPTPWSLTVISPNGGEVWEFGSTYNINWSSVNIVGNACIEISFDSGSTWNTIISSVPVSAGTASWLASVSATTTHTRMRVRSLDIFAMDKSDADFTIKGPPLPSLAVISPNGGESFAVGSIHNITWTPGLTGNVKIEFYDGSQWYTIDGNAPNSGSYSWTVLSQVTTHARVKLSAASNPTINDMSNADFSITGPTAFSKKVQPLQEKRILVIRERDGAIAGIADTDVNGKFRIALNNPGPCRQERYGFWVMPKKDKPPSENSMVSLEINVCNDLSEHEFIAWQMKSKLDNDYGITEEGIR